ncbi:hypothetical protein Tco_0060365 [Tanacetum coccineum]
METQKPLLKDEAGEEVDVHMYRSMIDSLMYLTSSRPNIMFAVCACARYQVNPKCKKQKVVANSIIDNEYVAASSCCGQVLWIQNQLLDYSSKTTAWNEFSSTNDKQVDGMASHKRIYIAPSHTKKIFGNMRRVGKGFSGRETPLFQTMEDTKIV